MTRWAGIVLVLAVGVSAGCADQEFEPPDRAARVARATEAFSVAMFDTVSWGQEAAQLTTGNTVYAEECRRCHGPLGQGGTDYALQRNLTVPTLVAPQWRLAQIDSLRRQIFIGHELGMPVFGDGDLTPRQVDATAAYILRSLRPDVLEQD
jgi:mono/diheme cytochrome c family protein